MTKHIERYPVLGWTPLDILPGVLTGYTGKGFYYKKCQTDGKELYI